jgi:hypothetical protein
LARRGGESGGAGPLPHVSAPVGPDVELAREVVYELVRTGLMLSETLTSLVDDLPADAFPGEDHGRVLLDMAAGTCAPVTQAAGEQLCRDAIGLLAAVRDKFLADLRQAAELAASKHQT